MVVQHGGVCWGVSTPSAEGWFYGNLKNNFQVIETKIMSIIFCLRKDPLNPTNWLLRRSENHYPAPDSLLPSINAGGKIICPTSHVQQKTFLLFSSSISFISCFVPSLLIILSLFHSSALLAFSGGEIWQDRAICFLLQMIGFAHKHRLSEKTQR